LDEDRSKERCHRHADIAANVERRHNLRRLLTQEDFLLLQKQVPDEIAFLESDMQRRVAEAVAKAASQRARRRRRIHAAKAVTAELRAKGIQATPALAASLAKLAAADGDDTAGDPVFAEAFALLAVNNAWKPHRRKHTRSLPGCPMEVAPLALRSGVPQILSGTMTIDWRASTP
jgi:hypothetical protein